MKSVIASLIVVLGLVAASPAFARTHKLPAAGLSVQVPAKWKVKAGKHQLDLVTRDKTLTITLTVIPGGNATATWDAAVTAVKGRLTDFEIGAKIGGTFGDLSGDIANAFGNLDGKPMEVLIAVLPTRRGNLLQMVAYGEAGKYNKHDGDLKKALGSFKATASAIAGDGFLALGPDAQLFAEKAALAIGKSDRKTFGKLADPALRKATRKSGKLAAALGLPAAGAWQVEPGTDASHVALWRGEPTDPRTFVELVETGGVWTITAAASRAPR